jgi:hypothetical protein
MIPTGAEQEAFVRETNFLLQQFLIRIPGKGIQLRVWTRAILTRCEILIIDVPRKGLVSWAFPRFEKAM